MMSYKLIFMEHTISDYIERKQTNKIYHTKKDDID